MAALIKRRSKKAGLPPGSLIHIGEKGSEEVRITVLDYDEVHYEEKEVKTIEESYPFRDKTTITWINIEGVHRSDIVEKIGNHFGIHPLIQEDILNTDQRPKTEDFENYQYTVLKMLHYDNKKNEIVSEQISLILGQNYVMSFQEGIAGDVFDPVRERLRTGKGFIRKMKADYLVYSLLDTIVDNYFSILENLGERTEILEKELVERPAQHTLQKLHQLKREMLLLRKSIWPLREVISKLEKTESVLITDSTKIHLRDVYDHVIYIIETIETYREMLSGILEIYLSSISNRTNQIVKVLTIITTIFMPLTFIAGIYGMNFKYMPELEWRWGYHAALFIMAMIGITMLVYFRRKRWL
ncbi:MAG TPA: magnesium/cobalt transporter CorA [bacterium]